MGEMRKQVEMMMTCHVVREGSRTILLVEGNGKGDCGCEEAM